MNTVVMSSFDLPKDPLITKKFGEFLRKLTEDDTLPGLHIEKIKGSADPRIRTGRVDRGYRAVMFKLTGDGAVTYVLHGICEEDEANRIAARAVVQTNPVNGVTEVRYIDRPDAAEWQQRNAESEAAAEDAAVGDVAKEADVDSTSEEPTQSLLAGHGLGVDDLTALGLEPMLAERACEAADEEALLAVAESAKGTWQGLVLIELGTGASVETVAAEYGLTGELDESGSEDDRLLRGLKHPAARLSFTWIEGDDELRRVVEGSDFAAWRIFLHPLQREYVDRDYNGPARLAGGAGTGKTVVLLHRAVRLAQENPQARILLTTFTRNLADALKRDLRALDPHVRLAEGLGEPGILVQGVDAAVRAVAVAAGPRLGEATTAVLGADGYKASARTESGAWASAIDAAGTDLPGDLAVPAFFEAEYAMVVLPKRVMSLQEYLRIPRKGRGTPLSRRQRAQVWAVIERYRASAKALGTLDFDELAMVAGACADIIAADGVRPFDHVLVDEGQDLTPAKWIFLRSLVEVGRNDLFIAEDMHQRIYGQKVTLSHYGIESRGRSRRLTLNYRTTQQNLRWAMSVLDGGEFEDLDGEAEAHADYRSARSGPRPLMLRAESFADELDQAAALLGEWTSEPDVKHENVAVLVRTKVQRDRVAAGLSERGVKTRPVDAESVRTGAVSIMTMHRAKGTEFARVLLMDIRDGAIPASVKNQAVSDADREDALLRERSLLYVAATRARDVLAVSWHGERSPLVQPATTR